MHYVLGLGSNLGSRSAHLHAALALLRAAADCNVLCVSPYYESDPIGPAQPRYLNAAASVACSLPAPRLLERLHTIESALGRDRGREQRWGPRTLDLDILWAERASSDGAEVPHPRLRERWFALRPLLAVAPELEPHYGAALVALAPEALRVCSPARSQLVQRGDVLELTTVANDLPDAVAASFDVLARALDARPGGAGLSISAVAAQCLAGSELEACWNAWLAQLSRGPVALATSVAALGGGRVELHLMAGVPRQEPPPTLTLLDVHAERGTDGQTCCVRTHLRAPTFRAS